MRPTVWRWCRKFLNLSRQFPVFSRDRCGCTVSNETAGISDQIEALECALALSPSSASACCELGRIGGAVRQGLASRACGPLSGRRVGPAHPCSTLSADELHCSIFDSSGVGDEDAARRRQRHDSRQSGRMGPMSLSAYPFCQVRAEIDRSRMRIRPRRRRCVRRQRSGAGTKPCSVSMLLRESGRGAYARSERGYGATATGAGGAG
jgi:hypothetical protein